MDYFDEANHCYNVKEYEKALKFYKKAIENKTYEACSYYNSAVCCIKLKEYQSAIELLKSAISLKVDSKYFFNLAYCYAMIKNNKKALVYFNTAWSLDNNDNECEKAINLIIKSLPKHP